MAFSEVFTGLQTGTINGQENPIEVPWTNKFSEVQKYVSLTNHINDAWVLALSSKKWGGLSDAQKKALTDASTETATFKTAYDEEQSKKQLDELTAKGMKVNELSAAGLEEFKATSKSLYPQFSELIGKEFFDEADRLHRLQVIPPGPGRQRRPGPPTNIPLSTSTVWKNMKRTARSRGTRGGHSVRRGRDPAPRSRPAGLERRRVARQGPGMDRGRGDPRRTRRHPAEHRSPGRHRRFSALDPGSVGNRTPDHCLHRRSHRLPQGCPHVGAGPHHAPARDRGSRTWPPWSTGSSSS